MSKLNMSRTINQSQNPGLPTSIQSVTFCFAICFIATWNYKKKKVFNGKANLTTLSENILKVGVMKGHFDNVHFARMWLF